MANNQTALTLAAHGTEYLMNLVGSSLYPRLRMEQSENQLKDRIDSYVEEVRRLFDWHFDEIQAIDHNIELSAEGKFRKAGPIQEKTSTAFNAICAKLRKEQEKHMSDVDKVFQLPPEVVGGDPVILELRCQEIRRHLLSLPMPQRIRLALGIGDAELIHAIDTAPECLELVPSEIVERSRKLRVRRKRGQQLEYLEDERATLEHINQILNGVASHLPWLTIHPNLWPLPESVYPESEDLDPPAPTDDALAGQMQSSAEQSAAFMLQ